MLAGYAPEKLGLKSKTPRLNLLGVIKELISKKKLISIKKNRRYSVVPKIAGDRGGGVEVLIHRNVVHIDAI